jgi:hypothetical protein
LITRWGDGSEAEGELVAALRSSSSAINAESESATSVTRVMESLLKALLLAHASPREDKTSEGQLLCRVETGEKA